MSKFKAKIEIIPELQAKLHKANTKKLKVIETGVKVGKAPKGVSMKSLMAKAKTVQPVIKERVKDKPKG